MSCANPNGASAEVSQLLTEPELAYAWGSTRD